MFCMLTFANSSAALCLCSRCASCCISACMNMSVCVRACTLHNGAPTRKFRLPQSINSLCVVLVISDEPRAPFNGQLKATGGNYPVMSHSDELQVHENEWDDWTFTYNHQLRYLHKYCKYFWLTWSCFFCWLNYAQNRDKWFFSSGFGPLKKCRN